MCNDYELNMALEEMNEAIDRQLGLPLRLPLPAPGSNAVAMDVPHSLYPRLQGLIIRPIDPGNPYEGLQPELAYWNLTPGFHKGTLKEWKASTNNCRSEDMADKASFKNALRKRRCLIPATAFFEWTGPKGTKTRHRIQRADGGLMLFAGLWETATTPDMGAVHTYTMVMRAAADNDDVAPFHHRQPVLLDRAAAATWLDLTVDHRGALAPPPAGTYVFDPPEPRAA